MKELKIPMSSLFASFFSIRHRVLTPKRNGEKNRLRHPRYSLPINGEKTVWGILGNLSFSTERRRQRDNQGKQILNEKSKVQKEHPSVWKNGRCLCEKLYSIWKLKKGLLLDVKVAALAHLRGLRGATCGLSACAPSGGSSFPGVGGLTRKLNHLEVLK